MECPLITEMSIVWNNQITPEEAGITLNDLKWKRPVYFIKTPYNSMDFRYLLPQESTAQVFFSMDDDVQVSCKELTASFKLWQAHAVGDIGPIVTYGPRGYDFSLKSSVYHYTDPGDG